MEPKREPLTESYFYILLCLYSHANHGYGIMQEAGRLSGGRVKIGSGTMYGAVSNMIKKGWIMESDEESEELQNRGQGFSRERLIEQVWGYAFTGETRTVDVHIRTLRQKLGPAGAYIQTVRGYGYKIDGEG